MGSEMCIRDRSDKAPSNTFPSAAPTSTCVRPTTPHLSIIVRIVPAVNVPYKPVPSWPNPGWNFWKMLLCCVRVTARRWRGAPTASTRQGTLSRPSKKGGTPRDAHGLLPSSLVGAAPLLLGFCLGRLRRLLLARCFDGRLRRLRHGLDLGRRLRVFLAWRLGLRRLLAFCGRQRGFILGRLGLGRHVRSPKGGRGARARGTRGRNVSCAVCACVAARRGFGARAC